MLWFAPEMQTLQWPGVLTAVKLQIPVVDIEARMLSSNREMPGRRTTKGGHLVADTMYGSMLQFAQTAPKKSSILLRESNSTEKPSEIFGDANAAQVCARIFEENLCHIQPIQSG